VKCSRKLARVKVSADGKGVVSHAGVSLLRELAEYTGLVDGISDALIGTYKGVPFHAPGRVFTDLAVAIADGADAVSGIAVLADRQELFGPVASMPTAWRVLDRIDAHHLQRVRAARGAARAAAWAAGAAPDLTSELFIDFDATITIARSEKENAAATWKRTFGFSPAAGVPGPARGVRWGGAGRAVAPGQRRLEHRGRPRHGAGPGARRAARAGPAPARRPDQSDRGGPQRLGRRHPRVRRGLPETRGRVLLRLPGRRTRATHRRPHPRAVLAPGAGRR